MGERSYRPRGFTRQACRSPPGGGFVPFGETTSFPLGMTLGVDNESDQVREGHLVNALALRGDEGRGTLR